MSTMYNPLNVMMGKPSGTGMPYVNPRPVSGGSVGPVNAGQFSSGAPKNRGSVGPISAGQFTSGPASPQNGPNVVGPEAVRATGTGPFDSAYRQDLATFAGGLFNRPGGNLSFNPTSPDAFGTPTGGGNAPLPGMPPTLLQNALGGNPFTYTPPAPVKTASGDSTMQSLEDWMQQFMRQGGFGRGGQNFNAS